MPTTMRSLGFLLICCSACASWAQDIAPFSVNAGYTVQTDSNLFRQSANFGAQAERVGISSLGLGFNTTQSLQKIEVNVNLIDYSYKNFDYLSFTARNYDAAWRWSVTPRWTGSLTSSRKETLNSFVDYGNISQRNQRLDANLRLDTSYELSGPWRLVGGATRTKQENQLVVFGDGDYRLTSGDAGLRYVLGSGSTLTYLARATNGDYLHRVMPNTGAFDESFHQFDHDLRLRWVLNGNSTVDAKLSYLSRSHSTYAERDYSGFANDIGLNWAVSGKTSVSAAYAHGLSTYATSYSNYAATDRITLGTQWQMSAKAALRFNHSWTRAEYLGSPTAVPSAQRRDTSRDTSLSVVWAPTQQIMLDASLQNQGRSSNLGSLDYDARLVTLTAQFTY
jgi:exopolysaccharide biosynthesis operon protein EpsL